MGYVFEVSDAGFIQDGDSRPLAVAVVLEKAFLPKPNQFRKVCAVTKETP